MSTGHARNGLWKPGTVMKFPSDTTVEVTTSTTTTQLMTNASTVQQEETTPESEVTTYQPTTSTTVGTTVTNVPTSTKIEELASSEEESLQTSEEEQSQSTPTRSSTDQTSSVEKMSSSYEETSFKTTNEVLTTDETSESTGNVTSGTSIVWMSSSSGYQSEMTTSSNSTTGSTSDTTKAESIPTTMTTTEIRTTGTTKEPIMTTTVSIPLTTTSSPPTSTQEMSSTATTSRATATSSPQTTMTISTSTLVPTLLPTVAPAAITYPVSSNYYFPDLNSNLTKTNVGNVQVVGGPFGFGSAVQMTSSENTCLHRTKFFLDQDKDCLQNPGNCSLGISVAIWQNIHLDIADNAKRYIFSTGGDTQGSPGVALYHQGVDLHAVVSNGSHYWDVFVAGQLPNNTWSNVGMKWSMIQGLEVYIDSLRIGMVIYPTETHFTPQDGNDPPEIAVGCHIVNEPRAYINYSSGQFDEVVLWMHRLNDTCNNYFLGGYDAIGANMTVESLTDIIKTKLNLSDPEQHKQAVAILGKMTENKGSGESSDEESTTTTVKLQTTTRPYLHDNSTSHESNETEATFDSLESENQDDQEPKKHSKLSEEVAKLQSISDIIRLMTNPDEIKLVMTPEEMGAFQDLLHVVSNMFSLEKKSEWLKIQQLQPGSSIVMDCLQKWAMALLQRTTPKRKSKSFHLTKTTENIVLTTTKMTIKEFTDNKGLLTPYYNDQEWAQVPWREGTVRLPLDSVQFSRELFNDLGRAPNSYIYIVNFLLSTYDDIASRNVNTNSLPSSNIFLDSKVITASMEPTHGMEYGLYYNPVIVTLAHNKKERMLRRKLLFHDESRTIPTVKQRYCAWWNPSVFPYGGWDSSGCELYHTSEEFSTCFCSQFGAYAIIGQNIERRPIYPDPMWLLVLKYVFYALSVICLLFYILAIVFSKNLKDQFHIIRLNMSIAVLAGTSCMLATDYVRGQRHECTAVTAVLHYSYVAVSCWLMMEAHAIFSTMMHGIIGGKLKAYFLFSWGFPMIFLGLAFLIGFQDYGFEPRCIVSWNDELKWCLFGPNLAIGGVSLIMTSASIVNTGSAAVKKETIFEDLRSVVWGLLLVILTFDMDWIFACLAYLDIELMYPDFYPIFQVLNASLGFMIFLFMGVGSKRFRIVMRGGTPDSRHLPNLSVKPKNLIPVKPQPKGPMLG